MSNIDEIMKEIGEIADEYYGTDDYDSAYEDDYQCAYWARSNADYLFSVIRNLSSELKSKQNQLEETEDLLQDALRTLDSVHEYDSNIYHGINEYFRKNNK